MYFKRSLPTSEHTGIDQGTIRRANEYVQRLLDDGQKSAKKQERNELSATAAIGKYAAENGNSNAQKHFKKNFPELSESTVHSFKKKYLSLIAIGKVNITSITTKYTGRPLVLGDFNQQVQKYLNSLRTADTAISAPLVIAAAEGMIEAKDRTLLVEHGGSINLTRSWAT